MEDNKEEIQRLEENIKKWQEELEKVWGEKETDSAIVEKNNLRNLIYNARNRINELENNVENQNELNSENTLESLEKKFEEIKKDDKSRARTVQISQTEQHIKRLKDEQKLYEDRIGVNKEIYDEYAKSIEKEERELSKLKKDDSLKENIQKTELVKQLINAYDDEIKKIDKEIRKYKRQVEDIEYGTEDAMETKEISIQKEIDGEIKTVTETVKVPKILSIYSKLSDLERKRDILNNKKEECKEFIEKINGVSYVKRDLPPEEIAFFHNQGDSVEYGGSGDFIKNRKMNDDYFFSESNSGNGQQNENASKSGNGKGDNGKGDNGKGDNGKGDNGKGGNGKGGNGIGDNGKGDNNQSKVDLEKPSIKIDAYEGVIEYIPKNDSVMPLKYGQKAELRLKDIFNKKKDIKKALIIGAR